MTATDELRALLDARGVEHRDRYIHTKGRENPGTNFTTWFVNRDNARLTARANERDNGEFGLFFRVSGFSVTPEQAIEATLGTGTCHITVQDNMTETEGMGDVWLECDACGWQMPLEPSTPRFNYCPNCGRRVEQ